MNIGPATAYSRWEDRRDGCVGVQQCGSPQPVLLHPVASSRGHCLATAGTPFLQEASWQTDHVGPLPWKGPAAVYPGIDVCVPGRRLSFLPGGLGLLRYPEL